MESRCAIWMQTRNLPFPTQLSRIFIYGAVLLTFCALLVGSFIVAGCLLFIWAIAFIMQSVGNGELRMSSTISEDSDGYRNGSEGFGNYVGGTRTDNK
ncbi:hypothetical protein [Salmonella enterica]|uniref:hypothetical protein n=1 Tax=Salmonella enterica TaxID=28901 RepID=UPI003F74E8AE